MTKLEELREKAYSGRIKPYRFTERELSELISQVRKEERESLVNSPQFGNFIEGLNLEMLHHEERWGDESQAHPHHFQMVLSMISGKLARAIFDQDRVKFEHHLITLSAVAGTCHKYFMQEQSKVNEWFSTQTTEDSDE